MGLSTSLPGSSQKRLTERFRLSPDGKNLIYSGVVEDPVYLTKPVEWTGQWEYDRACSIRMKSVIWKSPASFCGTSR